MHPESDDNSSVDSGDAFNYEAYSTYTKGAADKNNSSGNDRSLTISTNASMSPSKMNKAIKGGSSKSSSTSSVSDNEEESKDGSHSGTGPRGEHLKPRLCTVPGCKKRVRSKGLCKAHGGGRRCMVEGCERSSQGQGLCIRHGGGKRCTQGGCTKASQSNGLCKAHGGGLRCMANNCSKSSQGGGFCRAHGGGQRCEREGCNKGAQRGGFCAGHGGSRFCQHPDCTKNDRGGGYCAEHGGGKRCDQQGCNKPARKKGKCSHHANASKQKTPKDLVSTAPPMMDMRQITAPAASAYSMPTGAPKDMRDSMDHHHHQQQQQHPAIRAYPPVSSYQPRVEMDQRYAKGYDNSMAPSAASQYMPMHADQRGYDAIGMQQQQQQPVSRHYMDTSSLPSVSQGYATAHKHQSMTGSMAGAGMDRSVSPYEPVRSAAGHGVHGAGHHAHPAYSQHQQQQHWSSKDAVVPPPQSRANMDYFDIKDQGLTAGSSQPPSHHPAYNSQQSAPSYHHHHHLSAVDSAAAAAAAAAYSSQQQRDNYYHQHAPPPPSGAPSANDAPGANSSMMYNSYSYQQHQMHNMNLL